MSLDPSEARAVEAALAAATSGLDVPASARARDGLASALLPALHHLQDHLGHVPPGAVAPLASALGVSVADVHGVVSFYHDFRTRPPPRRVVRLCRAEACKARGADALVKHAERVTGVALGSERAEVGLGSVYCLGLCASAPAGTVDGRPVARLTPAALDRLLGAR